MKKHRWLLRAVPATIIAAGGVALIVFVFNLSISSEARGGHIAEPALPPVAAAATVPAPDRVVLDQFSAAFESAAHQVDPSVVAIFTESETPVSTAAPWGNLPFGLGDEWHRLIPFGNQAPEGTMVRHGLGSGVIVRPDGYILTNNHVIDDATKLVVRLTDRRELSATVVGRDPQSDLAVIRVDADDLPAATLGDSDELKVGTWVIAVGNPLEMYHTVTAGIVSATGRSSVGLSVYEDFIQTDASINPGNSGGALADLDGRVVGINTAIASPTGTNVGIGFAIPIDRARHIANDLIASGHVVRGYLALMPQDVDASLAEAMNLDSNKGALVADVTKDGPADHAGVEAGDVIVDYENKPVDDAADLRNLVADSQPGSTVTMTVVRDRHRKKLHVKLGERPEPREVASTGYDRENGSGDSSRGKLGLSIETLTPDIADRIGIKQTQGVLVEQVVPGSPADEAGLRRGDVIAAVGREPVDSAQQFVDDVRDAKPGDSLALRVQRGDGAFYAAVKLPVG
jgi:serine protease Do